MKIRYLEDLSGYRWLQYYCDISQNWKSIEEKKLCIAEIISRAILLHLAKYGDNPDSVILDDVHWNSLIKYESTISFNKSGCKSFKFKGVDVYFCKDIKGVHTTRKYQND